MTWNGITKKEVEGRSENVKINVEQENGINSMCLTLNGRKA